MLTSLSVRDVVLIERLDLVFGPGLLALTGETGAGKSILLDALGLVLGGRGEAALVRAGATAAEVAAGFEVGPDHPARALLASNDLEADGPILLRRTLRADGGGRAFAQDSAVGVGLLRSLGALLVEVHGQNDERGLLAARGHRALVDDYGGHGLAAVSAAWGAREAAAAALAAARAEAEADARDREWLDHAAGELAAFAPRAGEEAELADERAMMQRGARLAGDLELVDGALGGSDGALAGLRAAARRLERIAGDHALLGEALAALDRALEAGHEAETALAAAGRALGADPARLEAAEARLFELRALARKHRVEADALPALAAELSTRLDAQAEGGARVTRLEAEVAAAERAYAAAAAALTAARRAAADRLEAAVAAELAPLKLGAARFRVAIAPAEPGPSGQDRVEFEIATNAGAAFGPLTRIASGGELSRFTLALKVALAATREAGTLVFDEIDRGVGGAVASAVGERLARLAARTQVLVVTHSPQVAAAAARQWRIEKADAGGATRTDVVPLGIGARTEEIARMLSGTEITPEARAQAERLLAR